MSDFPNTAWGLLRDKIHNLHNLDEYEKLDKDIRSRQTIDDIQRVLSTYYMGIIAAPADQPQKAMLLEALKTIIWKT